MLHNPNVQPPPYPETIEFVVTAGDGTATTYSTPEYQHDPRNTANAGIDLAEFECP